MNNFNSKDFKMIKKLYFKKHISQYGISLLFHCHQSTISRIINDILIPYDMILKDKRARYSPNYIPSKLEPKQAKTLRDKRSHLPSTKLNEDIVESIRNQYFSGIKTKKELSIENNVNQSTISRIISGNKWKKIK